MESLSPSLENLYGSSIAVIVHSFDRSLFTHLIGRCQDLYRTH